MKLSLATICLRRSLGVYLADERIIWAMAHKMPFGSRITQMHEEPTTRAGWAEALHRIVESSGKVSAVKRTPVVIGLPTNHVFFATLNGGSKGESAETLLASNHCCTAIPPAELCCDVMPIKVNGKTLASVAASRRRDLQTLVDAVASLGVRFVRIEPAPWALLRSAKILKSKKMILRLFVTGRELIAMLVDGAQPLLWRILELPDDNDIAVDSIVSMVRTFEAYATQQLGQSSLDSIVLEGTEISEDFSQRLAGELGERFSAATGDGATAESICKGLALGGLNWELPTIDLARPLAPPPRLVDLIPRGETAMMGALVICTGLWLWGSGTVATNKAKRAEEENARNALLRAGSDGKLTDEKSQLNAEVSAVSKFLLNRISWTEYLNQLSSRLPGGVKIVSIQGDYEMTTGAEKNEKKTRKGLVIEFTTMLAHDVAAPPEVDKVLEVVRQTPIIVRDFPEIKLSTLRVNKSERKPGKEFTSDAATFAVSCMPKSKPAAMPKEAGGADSKSAAAKAD